MPYLGVMQAHANAQSGKQKRPLYLQRTMLVLLALGYGGGIPLEMAFNIMPTWASAAGWSVMSIGLLSLAKLPYAFKVLWAPLADHCSIPGLRWMGRRRAWLLMSQCLCMFMILVLAWNMDHRGSALAPTAMLVLLGILVFAGATQDIVGDAFRAEVLTPRELGAGASVFVTGARIASVVGGAGALIIASRLAASESLNDWSWGIAIGLLALSSAAGMAGTWFAKEPERPAGIVHGFSASVMQPFQIFAQGWGSKLAVLFAFTMLFRLPDNLGGAMNSPLLVQGLGYSTETIGWVRQGMGFSFSILGAMVGGWLVARWGIIRCLWVFGALQAASNVGFLVLAEAFHATVLVKATHAPPTAALAMVIMAENLCGGLVSCGFVAYMMSVCDRRATATQYALLTGFMAIGNSLSGWMGGWMVHHFDYSWFFLLSIVAAVPGMALIPVLARVHRALRATTATTATSA